MATNPNVGGAALPTLNGPGTPAQTQNVVNGPPIPVNPNYNVFAGLDKNGNPIWRDVTSAKKDFYILPQKDISSMVSTMDTYYGKGKWKWSDIQDGWNTAVDMAASYFAYDPSKRVTAMDAFKYNAQRNAASGLSVTGKLLSGGAGGAGGPTYAIQKSVNLTDPSTARGLVSQAMENYLGRKATPKEQQTFLKALNAQEEMAPTITEQRTSRSGRSSSTTSRTTGGFNPATFAQEWAAGQEGSAEFQAATTFLDTFINAIGAKV